MSPLSGGDLFFVCAFVGIIAGIAGSAIGYCNGRLYEMQHRKYRIGDSTVPEEVEK